MPGTGREPLLRDRAATLVGAVPWALSLDNGPDIALVSTAAQTERVFLRCYVDPFSARPSPAAPSSKSHLRQFSGGRHRPGIAGSERQLLQVNSGSRRNRTVAYHLLVISFAALLDRFKPVQHAQSCCCHVE